MIIYIISIITIIIIDDGEEYDRRLKKLMQECLPGILADVVEERPADPIEFIAHALYKYKVKFTLSMLTSGDFCHLLITFANSFEPDLS